MILIQLGLHAFGRFHNQNIHLEKGLNLICGENETGKSTIHRFIRGMLFGFKRENSQRRYFTPELDQYRPWTGKDYRGSLEYQHEDGQRILVERFFDTDETRIYDALTGKSLESQYAMDSRKEYLFAENHLGFNATVFDNTIFLAQLGGKTGKELAREVADRLSRLTGSGREDLSVKEALGGLRKRKDEIGSFKAVSRPLGKAVRMCEDLFREKKDVETLYASLRRQQEEKADLEKKCRDLLGEQAQIKQELEEAERIQTYQDASRVVSMWQEREELEKITGQKRIFADFPDYVRDELHEAITRINTLKESSESFTGRIEETALAEKNLLTEMGRFPAETDYDEKARQDISFRFSQLQANMKGLEKLRTEKKCLEEEKESLQDALKQRPHLKTAYDNIALLEAEDEERERLLASSLSMELAKLNQTRTHTTGLFWRWSAGTLLAVLAGGAGVVSVYSEVDILPAAIIALLSLVVLLVGTSGVQKFRRQSLRIGNEMKRLVTLKEHEQKNLEQINEHRQNILETVGVDSMRKIKILADEYEGYGKRQTELDEILTIQTETISELIGKLQEEENALLEMIHCVIPDSSGRELDQPLVESYLKLLQMQQQKQEKQFQLQEQQQALHRDHGMLQTQIFELEKTRDRLFRESNVDEWEEFLKGCQEKERYHEALKRRDELDDRLEPYLKKRNLSQWLSLQEEDVHQDSDPVVRAEDLDRLKKQLEDSTTHLQETKVRMAALDADMERALDGSRDLNLVEEDLFTACRDKELWSDEAAALELAIEVLEAVADKRHRLLAPALNSRVGEIIAHVTQGRYQKVRIDEDLTIIVSTPDGGHQVDLSSLSAGTVDQFYFAVRVAMADLISQEKKLPLFLDDPFVQYSSRRLHQVLQLLGELAQQRQILLFTCRDREEIELEKLKIPFHRICLNEKSE